jgi:hypothetical protein
MGGGDSPVDEMQHLLITIGIDLSVASNVILRSGWCEANIGHGCVCENRKR